MANENDQHPQNHQTTAKTNDIQEQPEKNIVEHLEGVKDAADDSEDLPTASKGKLNDLVADLCLNGHRSLSSNQQESQQPLGCYGDYTNIRATLGPVGLNDSSFPAKSSMDSSNQGLGSDSSYGCNSSMSTHNVQQQPTQQPHTHNSSFSFKHFLSSGSVPTAPSTTVTSLDPPANSTSTTSSANATSSRSLQTSTGARPKVPQSNSISSLTVGGSNDTLSSAATKMKRSPRFSSFDSQASLAEYAGSSTTADLPPAEASAGNSSSSDFCLYPDERERDRFQEWNLSSNAPTLTRRMRRRVGIGATGKDSRPTCLALNTSQNSTAAAKLKLDLPLTSNSTGCGSGATGSSHNTSGNSRKNAIRPTDFQPSNPLPGGAAAAAALPDFVQDHWMDSWYANDMHVNSPPSSPTQRFLEDLAGAGGGQASGGIGQAGAIHLHNNSGNRALHIDPLPGPADIGDFNMGLPEQPSSSVGSKMLPDFLSDGPIIHSSQRLADVAAGLPSNSIGSPEESSMNNQLSRLRSDNERLQRELNETRAALNEQTLRANNLERQLVEQQKQHKTETEETLDSNKKRSAAVQTHVVKLKQQVQQLTAKVETLRREKELLREEGAVGGCSLQSCDRSYTAAAVSSTTRSPAAATGAASGGGISSVTDSVGGVATLGIRPSKQQQISSDLRRAASNAEQNLKQLLAGVENLRQMAANIEKSETNVDYDASPDLFSDFIDECDDYDEYSGGPAL